MYVNSRVPGDAVFVKSCGAFFAARARPSRGMYIAAGAEDLGGFGVEMGMWCVAGGRWLPRKGLDYLRVADTYRERLTIERSFTNLHREDQTEMKQTIHLDKQLCTRFSSRD